MITLLIFRDSYPHLVVSYDKKLIQRKKYYENNLFLFTIDSEKYFIHYQTLKMLISLLNSDIENQPSYIYKGIIKYIYPPKKFDPEKILDIFSKNKIIFTPYFSYIFNSIKNEIYNIDSNSFLTVKNKKIIVQIYLPESNVFYVNCMFETLNFIKNSNKNKEFLLDDKELKKQIKSKKHILENINQIFEYINENSIFFIRID